MNLSFLIVRLPVFLKLLIVLFYKLNKTIFKKSEKVLFLVHFQNRSPFLKLFISNKKSFFIIYVVKHNEKLFIDEYKEYLWKCLFLVCIPDGFVFAFKTSTVFSSVYFKYNSILTTIFFIIPCSSRKIFNFIIIQFCSRNVSENFSIVFCFVHKDIVLFVSSYSSFY